MIFLRNIWKLPLNKGVISGLQSRSLSHRWFSTTFRCNNEVSPSTLPTFELRGYQNECIKSCLESLESGKRRIGVSLPTGGGKTVVFCNLIDKVKPADGHGNKTMILAHRKELILQAAATCRRIHPDKNIEVEMANYKATEDADIVIASVQTLMRGRLEKFDPKDFKLVIVDEAHHAAADSYVFTFRHFGITEPDSDVALIGFSATLQRSDTKNLSEVFDDVVFHMDTDQMVTNKHLCEAKFTTVKMVDADLSNVSKRGGEFIIPSLSKEVNKPENNELVLRTYLHFVQSQNVRSTLIFGVDIAHVTAMVRLFQDRGINASFVTSHTKDVDRKERVALFKSGKISVLMNCGIFTEGTDIPNIDCVLLVRPTQSQNLLIQMIGRGLRLHHSKDFCHIVDFVGINNASVVSVPSLRGLPSDEEINGLTIEEIEERKLKYEDYKKRKEEQKLLEEQELQAQEEMQLREGMSASAPVPQYDEQAFDAFEHQSIELKTYESFRDFLNTGDVARESDEYYVKSSKYPWIKAGNNLWILGYPSLKPGVEIHLRLERHKRGLPKSFVQKVVKFRDVYKSGKDLQKTMDVKSTVYTLTSYTYNPLFSESRFSYIRKYNIILLLPVTKDIKLILSYVDKVLKERFRKRELTKYASWRKAPASIKQQKFFYTKLKKFIADQPFRVKNAVISEMLDLTKGELTDILLPLKIFGDSHLHPVVERLVKRADRADSKGKYLDFKNVYEFFDTIKTSPKKQAKHQDFDKEYPPIPAMPDPQPSDNQFFEPPI